MRLAVVLAVIGALSGLGPSSAEAATPAIKASGKISGLDVHEAARFLADIYRAQVVVLGGDGSALTFDWKDADAATVFAQLARAASLRLVRRDATFVIAPKDIIAAAEAGRRGLPADGRLSLDLLDVDAMVVFGRLADVLKLGLDGTVRGRVSVFGTNFGALTLVGILSRLSGREASRHVGRLLVSGVFPDGHEAPPLPPCMPDVEHKRYFQCVDAESVEVLGSAITSDDGAVTARAKTADSTSTQALIVHVNGCVGKEGAAGGHVLCVAKYAGDSPGVGLGVPVTK